MGSLSTNQKIMLGLAVVVVIIAVAMWAPWKKKAPTKAELPSAPIVRLV